MRALQIIARAQRLKRLRTLRDELRPKQLLPTTPTEADEPDPHEGPAVDAAFAPVRLYDFIPLLGRNYEAPRHLDRLVAPLEASWSRSVRQTGHAPPRHAKTDTVLAYIALTLRRFPWKTLAYISYEANVALGKSRKARLWALQAGVRLAEGARSLREWRTVEGGGLLAGGIGGPLTSHGVDVLIVDDPYKNRQQAESAAYRSMVFDWWDDVAETRLEDGGSAFIFHTRWTVDDLIAHVLEGDQKGEWEQHIRLPAVNDAGEALWPKRWPVSALKPKMANAYAWASLYQGLPRPRGATLFNGVRHYKTLPTQGFEVAIGIDLAYTKKTQADWSVAVVLARVMTPSGPLYYVLDVVRRQCKVSEFRPVIDALKQRYPSAPVLFRGAGQEGGITDLLDELGTEINFETASGDKFMRAQDVAAEWNDIDEGDGHIRPGRIFLPEHAPWLHPFLQVVHNFTGTGGVDDDVDALGNAHAALSRLHDLSDFGSLQLQR